MQHTSRKCNKHPLCCGPFQHASDQEASTSAALSVTPAVSAVSARQRAKPLKILDSYAKDYSITPEHPLSSSLCFLDYHSTRHLNLLQPLAKLLVAGISICLRCGLRLTPFPGGIQLPQA